MSRKFTSAQFAAYETAAAATRKALGLSRLSPNQAAEVRASVAKHEARQAVKSPKSTMTPVERIRRDLAIRAASKFAAALRGNYKAFSLDNVRVSFTKLGTAASISTNTTTKYVSGRRGFGHVTDGQTITACLQAGWVRKVWDANLAELDGLTTLSAELVSTDGDVSIYRASWVRQGRGYDLSAQHGFIATTYDSIQGRTSFHSTASAAAALTGLRRKLKPLAVRQATTSKRQATAAANRLRKIDALVSRVARWDFVGIDHVTVSRADSLKAGNCAPGTDAFIDRFGDGRTEATLGEIAVMLRAASLESLSTKDLELARQLAAACLVAIRRDKAANRALVMA